MRVKRNKKQEMVKKSKNILVPVIVIFLFIGCSANDDLKGIYILDYPAKDTLYIMDKNTYKRVVIINNKIYQYRGNWYSKSNRHLELTNWLENEDTIIVYFSHNYNFIRCSEIYTDGSGNKVYKKIN